MIIICSKWLDIAFTLRNIAMAKMKHESIQPSVTTEGMHNIWITIRVVDLKAL